jgi:glyoxylase-like metal-dependent hydrolase (beta-lactamase superfamily II)
MMHSTGRSYDKRRAVRNFPHRRQVLAGIAAAGAAGALPSLPAFAATAPFHRKLGALEVSVFSDGTLQVPQSFSLPDNKPDEIAALLKSNGQTGELPPAQTNITLVKSGSELILIDAGSGPNFQPTAGKLMENLEAAGIAPEKITKVVFTHVHADHLWGAIDDFDDAPRYPNASYVISAAEWDFWNDAKTAETAPDWLKGMAIGTARMLKKLESKIERRKPGDTVAPGLTYVDSSGHTPGHCCVLVESNKERLLIGGDVFNNGVISFTRPDWRVGADFDRDKGIATRKRMLGMLASEKIPLIAFHVAWPGHGMVETSGNTFRFVQV